MASEHDLSGLTELELKTALHQARTHLEELRASFQQLRAGGCAMERLIENAEEECDRLEAELRRRGVA